MATDFTTITAPTVRADEAFQVACTDAVKVYRDLHLYRAEVVYEDDGWHVDFVFKDDFAQSGGGHYIIDATTGRILTKRYEQ